MSSHSTSSLDTHFTQATSISTTPGFTVPGMVHLQQRTTPAPHDMRTESPVLGTGDNENVTIAEQAGNPAAAPSDHGDSIFSAGSGTSQTSATPSILEEILIILRNSHAIGELTQHETTKQSRNLSRHLDYIEASEQQRREHDAAVLETLSAIRERDGQHAKTLNAILESTAQHTKTLDAILKRFEAVTESFNQDKIRSL